MAEPLRLRIRPEIVLVAGLTLVFLLLSELALGWLLPYPDPYAADKVVARYVPSAHLPDQEFRIVVEEGLPGVEPVHAGRVNVFTTNALGFRGQALRRPKPTDELRIFVVGGSTTECIVLDDTQDMSRVAQERMRAGGLVGATVYNAGKSGDRSYDHLAMVSQRIAHLEPDVVVVFAGVNDLMAGIFGVDYLQLQPLRLTRGRLLRMLASESQLFRRLHAVARSVRRRTNQEILETVAFETDYARKAALQRAAPVIAEAPRTDVPAYERNLRSIAGVARAGGARLIFMTQASTWNGPDPEAEQWQWMRLRLDGTFGAAAMDAALERYNDATRRVAADTGSDLVDLARDLPKTLDYFYDDVHFNGRGAAAAGDALAAVLDGR